MSIYTLACTAVPFVLFAGHWQMVW